MPASASDPARDPTLGCPQCQGPMAQLSLRAHADRRVVIDHCAACRLVWFDALESVQLAGLGWVELLREISRDKAWDAPGAGRPATLGCPVCQRPLKTVHNRSRWGRFPMQECPVGHGHLNTDAGLLAERGLVRPLLPPERHALQAGRRRLSCLSCGAPAEGDGETCAWCATPLLVVDLPRLGHALRQRGVDNVGGRPLPPADGVPLRWPCHACGHTLDPTRVAACPQCGAGLLAPAIADLRPLLDGAEHELRAAANHPPRPRRSAPVPRSWRDTQLGRLWRLFSSD